MKILHSKSTAEPILLVCACHNMNLVAVVTPAAAVIYRATTLTVVASLSLKLEAGFNCQGEKGNGTQAVQACWSPSGRIFSLALATGVILLLDVENGTLVRRLVPKELHVVEQPCQEQPRGEDSMSDREKSEEEDKSAGKDEEKDEEEEARKISCEEALSTPPSVPISIPSAPVLSLAWATVDTSSTAPPFHSRVSQECLPLRPGISQPLLQEIDSSGTLVERKTDSLSVSFLVVLGKGGSVSVVAGGLQEVLATTTEGCGAVSSGSVDQFVITPCVPSVTQTREHEAPSLADSPPLCSLSAKSLLAAVASLTSNNSKQHRAAAKQHCGYLVVRDDAGQHLCGLDFQSSLATLSAHRSLPVLCRVAEHCRTAWACLENAHAQWRYLLQRRISQHLRMPECAELLRDAVVEAVALPDERELEEYYASLDHDALALDLDAISLVTSVLANDIYGVCYRAYDLSFSLVAELSVAAVSVGEKERAVYEHLCDLLAAHRRYCESFLLRIRKEGSEAVNVICFALQRASLLFDLPNGEAAAELDKSGNLLGAIPLNYASEPLPTARHPALLATLERLMHTSSFSSASPSDTAFQDRHTEMDAILHAGLSLQATKTVLPCQMISMGAEDGTLMDIEALNAATGDAKSAEEEGSDEGASNLRVDAVRISTSSASELATVPATLEGTQVATAFTFAPLALDANPSVSAALPSPQPTVAWYKRMGADQHILLLVSADKEVGEADCFTLVVVDDDGNVKVKDDEEDEEGEEEENEESKTAKSDNKIASNEEDTAANVDGVVDGISSCDGCQLLVVKGMEVGAESLMASLSSGRQFCVVAANSRFVVIDLFDA